MIRIFNKKLIQKSIAALMVVILVLPTFFFTTPKKAVAATPVADFLNTVQNTITSINSGITSTLGSSDYLKEYVLDPLAYMLAKQIVRQLTTSIVTWINSGFEGSPSFVQNPGAFFLDVADQTTGAFLEKNGGPLTDLCTPFSIDIRLALAFRYRPNTPKRYECTLGKIITNTKNAVAGASINGFTAGDFKQGGWPAFVSLTTEPQNNVYGAYLSAESELSIRVASAQLQKKDEISAGRGFLSWRDPKCKNETNTHNAEVKKNQETIRQQRQADVAAADSYGAAVPSFNSGGESAAGTLKSVADCPVQTPGSVIAGQLDHTLGGPLRQLELADEINEIVNALFAQLVTQVLQNGLAGVSGSGAGDSTSYISQVQNEAAAANNTGNVAEIRNSLLNNTSIYITNTTQYKANKDAAVTAITNSKNNYDAVAACYQAKLADKNINLNESQTNAAKDRIAAVNSKITTQVAPIAAVALTGASDAQSRLDALNKIKVSATAAKTINDLNIPSQQYSTIVQERRMTSANDIVASQNDLDTVKSQAAAFDEESGRLKQECDLFPQVYRR